ncbi:MAG TPA: alpha/beta fold hydrolase [Ktedonobacterales bacterium]|nr:alpha/beta fold hydrolase [Ktedonobacterales bacterium]
MAEVEERVQIAIDNWAPRFIANGVDSNDLLRLTHSVQRWEDWSPSWFALAAVHERLGAQAEAQRNYESAGEHYLQAAMLYHFGKFMVVRYPDLLRTGHENNVRVYQRGLPLFEYSGERVEIPYENGRVIPAILRKPPHRPRAPIVILSPGLDSVKEELHSYGNDLLRRGLATLAIDGPGQGESEFDLPLRPDYEVPIRYVIDYLSTRDDVDAGRVGMLGVSLGGFFAARAAAHEPRLKAAVMLAAAYDLSQHFDRYPLLTQEAFIHRLKAGDEATAREKLKAFTLAGQTEHITCPFLVIFGRRDRLFPPEDSERVVAEVGANATLWMFDDGNHVCNNIPYKYRPQQADWLRSALG